MPETQFWAKEASVEGDSRDDRPRKKRRKYIARAWYVVRQSTDPVKLFVLNPMISNECKRRKIKCNGENPCYRCGRQRIDCVYVETPRRESTSEPE